MRGHGDDVKGKVVVYVDEDLEELVPGFLENRQEDIKAIRGSLEEGDLEKIRIIGHSMKGSGGGYGFDRVSQLGMALEEAAKEGEKEEISRLVEELAGYLDKVEVVYREEG